MKLTLLINFKCMISFLVRSMLQTFILCTHIRLLFSTNVRRTRYNSRVMLRNSRLHNCSSTNVWIFIISDACTDESIGTYMILKSKTRKRKFINPLENFMALYFKNKYVLCDTELPFYFILFHYKNIKWFIWLRLLVFRFYNIID